MTWVKGKNGIKRWEGPRPIDEPDPPLAKKKRARQFIARPRTGDICDDCGCLNAPGERCVGCLAWAERNAVAASWLAHEYPIHEEMRAA